MWPQRVPCHMASKLELVSLYLCQDSFVGGVGGQSLKGGSASSQATPKLGQQEAQAVEI